MKKRIIVSMLLIIFILTVTGCSKNDKGDYVAKIDGQIITQAQLDKRVNMAAVMNGFDLSDPQLAGFQDYYQLQVLNDMIDEILLNQGAKERKLKVAQEEIANEISAIKEQFGSEKEFKSYFNDQLKMSEKDLEQTIEQYLLTMALFEDVTGDITTPNINPQEYYEENKGEFYQEEELVRARHILLKTKEEAEEIIKQIVEEKQDMAQLAVLKSIDPSAQSNQGDLGYFPRGQMVKPFEDAAFGLNVGEITKTPVQSSHGYHVIRLEDKIEVGQQSFEKIKEQLEERLIYEEKNEAFFNFVNELRSKAEIENVLAEKIKAEQEKAAQEEQEAQDEKAQDNEEQSENETNDKK